MSGAAPIPHDPKSRGIIRRFSIVVPGSAARRGPAPDADRPGCAYPRVPPVSNVRLMKSDVSGHQEAPVSTSGTPPPQLQTDSSAGKRFPAGVSPSPLQSRTLVLLSGGGGGVPAPPPFPPRLLGSPQAGGRGGGVLLPPFWSDPGCHLRSLEVPSGGICMTRRPKKASFPALFFLPNQHEPFVSSAARL